MPELSIAYELYAKPDAFDSAWGMELVHNAGFTAVDLSLGPFWKFPGSPLYGERWEGWAEHMADLATRNGLRMAQAHCWLYDIFGEGLEARDGYEANLRVAEACGRMGIPWLVFHPGTVCSAGGAKASLDRNLSFYGRIGEILAGHGVRLALENVFDWTTDHTDRLFGAQPDELLELTERLGAEAGICWDTGHAHLMGLDQEESLVLLGNRVKLTHLHDNRGRMNFDLHIPPFYGSIRWDTVMRGLKRIGYTGTLNYETEVHTLPPELFGSEFLHLHRIGEQLCALYARV